MIALNCTTRYDQNPLMACLADREVFKHSVKLLQGGSSIDASVMGDSFRKLLVTYYINVHKVDVNDLSYDGQA